MAGGAGRDRLIERDEARAVLARLLAGVLGGHGGTVLVEAPPGTGATALLQDLATHAEAHGAHVVAAHGDRLEQDLPFGVLRQLLEAPARAAARGPDPGVLGGPAAPARDLLLGEESAADDATLAHAVAWLVRGLAGTRPLLLLVGDAHWADARSARALLHLGRRLEDVPAALVVALRPGDPGAPAELREHLGLNPRTEVVELAPLSAQGTAALVRAHVPDASDALCGRCHTAAAGRPGLTAALAEAVATGGEDVLRDDGTLTRPPPRALDHALRRRVAALPPEARHLAEALAVLGDDASPPVLATLAGLAPAALPEALDTLRVAGLLADGRSPALPSPLVRQVLHRALAPALRSRLHDEAAGLLTAAGAPAETIAGHLLERVPSGDDAAVATLRAAAAAAGDRGAPDRAAVYLQRALDEPAPPGARAEVLVELATAEFDAGLPTATGRLRTALIGLTDHAQRIDVLTRLAALEVLHQDGGADAGLFERELLDVGSDAELHLAAELATIEVLLMLPDRQFERQRRVARLPGPQGIPTAHDRAAMAHRAWMEAERGEASRTLVHELAWRAVAGDALLELSLHRPTFHLACRALIVADAFDHAAEALDRLDVRIRRLGSPIMRAAIAHYRSDLHLRSGHVVEAEAEARLALDMHTGRDLVFGGAVEALVNALVERDELDAAQALLVDVGWDGPLGDDYREIGLRLARARLALARGDADAALADARDCGRLRERQGRPNPAWTPWRSTAAIACVLAGDRSQARTLAEEELRRARVFGAPRALGLALRAAALAADTPEELLRRHEEAVVVLAPSGARLEHGRALTDLGAALRRGGDPVAAREPLRTALALADGLGALALAARARRELFATGLRPRRAQIAGVASLTPQQRRVCDLAAAGRTNREIAAELVVTIKTVETHLAAAYRKLGVGGKAELAAVLTTAPAADG